MENNDIKVGDSVKIVPCKLYETGSRIGEIGRVYHVQANNGHCYVTFDDGESQGFLREQCQRVY